MDRFSEGAALRSVVLLVVVNLEASHPRIPIAIEVDGNVELRVSDSRDPRFLLEPNGFRGIQRGEVRERVVVLAAEGDREALLPQQFTHAGGQRERQIRL